MVVEGNKVTFTNQDVARLLVKEAGVREGRWALTVTFSFSVGNIGPSPDVLYPAVCLRINSIGIERITMELPANSLTVNAETVNRKAARRGR